MFSVVRMCLILFAVFMADCVLFKICKDEIWHYNLRISVIRDNEDKDIWGNKYPDLHYGEESDNRIMNYDYLIEYFYNLS